MKSSATFSKSFRYKDTDEDEILNLSLLHKLQSLGVCPITHWDRPIAIYRLIDLPELYQLAAICQFKETFPQDCQNMHKVTASYLFYVYEVINAIVAYIVIHS